MFVANATRFDRDRFLQVEDPDVDLEGVATDRAGNVYFCHASRVWRLNTTTGLMEAVAGIGAVGFDGDGGPATSAALAFPYGVAVDGGGNVLIADSGNHRIRRVAVGTGIITTVAGNGTRGFSGNGGPATSAALANPYGVAVDGGGNVLIADSKNNRIRIAPQPCRIDFRTLPRTDLVGVLVGHQAVLTSSEAACRQACCDAPVCDGYSFVAGAALLQPFLLLQPYAPCYLLTNITQLVPMNFMASGVRESVLL